MNDKAPGTVRRTHVAATPVYTPPVVSTYGKPVSSA
jgi:hypothetical protein